MTIYFIRHGESEGNASETHQTLSTPLSVKGHTQAKKVAERLALFSIDAIYSSDYLRAQQTAEHIAKKIQKPPILTPLLREMKKPEEIENKYINDPEVMRIKQLQIKNQHDPSWHYSDEENVSDLHSRAEKVLQLLINSNKSSLAVVTHGSFTRMLITTMLFGETTTPALYQPFRHFLELKNTGISTCAYEDNRWRLATWNDYRHLEDIT